MTIKARENQSLTMETLVEYVKNRTGPLASTSLTQITAFLETPYAKPGIPDIQIFFNGFDPDCSNTGLVNECSNGKLGKCSKRRSIIMRPVYLSAKSRGYMTLQSNNPMDYPLFYPNYFTNKTDITALLAGVKMALKIIDTPTMKKWGLKLSSIPHSMCKK